MKLLLLLLTSLCCPALAHAAEWEKLKVYDDGILLERRSAPGTAYWELRGSVRIALPPAAVFESVWRIRDEGYEARITKKRVILKDTPNERVVYSQVRLPVVADRDYTLRLEAKRDVGVDVYQILYRTDNASGPKATTDHVRIELIRGGWTFEPDGEGGCLVTYFFLNDPGGVIPAFLARGYQGDVLASVLREALVFAASDAKKRDPFAH